ncbi:hypothetical protein CDAR_494191 [Caerostris darwini]|uniref:Uncharacterized protein n=1 Tax=Caerostris darwini TaxID=1538125 RepID=A0AAV4TRS9_9ARAC|nr:hypothetical protein CDAR_494191 [Caerostris darwini]
MLSYAFLIIVGGILMTIGVVICLWCIDKCREKRRQSGRNQTGDSDEQSEMRLVHGSIELCEQFSTPLRRNDQETHPVQYGRVLPSTSADDSYSFVTTY